MKTLFKKSETNFGCYKSDGNKQNKFIKTENFRISDVLSADVSLKDKAWFIRNNCEFTTEEYRKFAIGCALVVLPIYEKKYPENKAPREAIQAVQDYLNNIITIDELLIKRRAAYAAAYAAYAADAAYAAYAAAYAAYAADAADAADAAYAADAADAADAAAYKQLLLEFFIEFTSNK